MGSGRAFTIRDVQVSDLHGNDWNPNEMPPAVLERLVAEIVEVGFLAPPEVVPVEGGYRIISGAHRVRAAGLAGLSEIPALVLDGERWKDEDLQRFRTVRENIIRGALDPEKFVSLYNDLAKRHDKDALQALMGFTDKSAWARLTKGVEDGVKDLAGKEAAKRFKEKAEGANTVGGLQAILTDVLGKASNTIDRQYLFFSFGGRRHVYVECDRNLYSRIKQMADQCEREDVSMRDSFKQLLDLWDRYFAAEPGGEA